MERLRCELRHFARWAVQLDRPIGQAEARRWAVGTIHDTGFDPDCIVGHEDVPYPTAVAG